jgi:hypothetical protein
MPKKIERHHLDKIQDTAERTAKTVHDRSARSGIRSAVKEILDLVRELEERK